MDGRDPQLAAALHLSSAKLANSSAYASSKPQLAFAFGAVPLLAECFNVTNAALTVVGSPPQPE